VRLGSLASIVLATATSACATRAQPYRFAAPMVAGVELDERAWPAPRRAAEPVGPAREPSTVATATTRAPADPLAPPTSIDPRALPAPHRGPRPRKGEPAAALSAPPAAPLTPSAALALAGTRDGRDPLDFALDLRARLAGDRWDADDGPSLVVAAKTRNLWGAPTDPIRPGALLVFDRAVARAPASLVAVALAVDDRGVVTMIFLGAGVARIGYVDPAHPAQKRDAAGRVRNTFLRHRDEEPPPGTHFLAGELLAGVIAAP
jgi:hypothetical protein